MYGFSIRFFCVSVYRVIRRVCVLLTRYSKIWHVLRMSQKSKIQKMGPLSCYSIISRHQMICLIACLCTNLFFLGIPWDLNCTNILNFHKLKVTYRCTLDFNFLGDPRRKDIEVTETNGHGFHQNPWPLCAKRQWGWCIWAIISTFAFPTKRFWLNVDHFFILLFAVLSLA